MKRILNMLLLLVIMFVFMYMPIVPYEKTDAKTPQTIREMREDLAELERQYNENKNKEKLTNEEIAKINNKVLEINKTIKNIGNEIIQLNEEIEKLEEDIKYKDEQIKKIANFVQLSNGESMYLEYIFGAKNFTDFIYRIAISEQLSNYNKKLIEEHHKMIKESEDKKISLNQKEKDLDKERESLGKEIAKLRNDISKLYEVSVSLEDVIKEQKKVIQNYKDLGCKDDDLISDCVKTGYDVSFWRPLNSSWVTSPFGPRKHPQTGKESFHEGIDLSANVGTKVYAVANGVVSHVGQLPEPCRSYIVVLKHVVNGKKYSTYYLHFYTIYVKFGDVVNKNTVLGLSGGDPIYTPWDKCSTGGHLHFGMSTGFAPDEYALWSPKYFASLLDPMIENQMKIPYSFNTRY